MYLLPGHFEQHDEAELQALIWNYALVHAHGVLRAIVGIEIPVQRLVGKWKIRQNRAEADRLGVAAGLAQEAPASAQAMATLVAGPVKAG